MVLSLKQSFCLGKIIRNILCVGILSYLSTAMAAPKEIILFRHFDKRDTNAGIALSPNGFARSVEFADYFINKFHYPDIVIATKPDKDSASYHSLREIQSVLPLIDEVTQQTQHELVVQAPYHDADYKKLAKDLLTKSQYDQKIIAISWHHHDIIKLAKALGSTAALPAWPDDTYDNVIVLHYDNGEVSSTEYLTQQFPLPQQYNWQEISTKLLTN